MGATPRNTDCIFCKIIGGEIPCSKVFESETVFAFLDIAPVNLGHALVIPKGHYPQLGELPIALGNDLLEALKVVGNAVMQAAKAEGLNIGMNNFEAAGQLVMHAHFHVIPRFADDGLTLWPSKKYTSMDEMNSLAETIRNLIK
ncbi:MAG: HIT family protein [Proteobacteria bacterium]|nr:HIT family protein [Pseudomonadota bacterium]MBU1610763.1 HIT family protein [Pseudomonadota bacterium]